MEESTPLITELQEHRSPQSKVEQPQIQKPQEVPFKEQNPLINSPFSQYFTQHLKQNRDLLEIDKKYNRQLQKKLAVGIEEGTVKVSRKKKHFKIKQEPQPTVEQQLQMEKSRFVQKKKEVLQNLHEIYLQEKDLLIKNRSFMRGSRISRSHSSMLHPSQNWLEEIKTAIKKHRKFKKEIKKKDQLARQMEELVKQDVLAHRRKSIHQLQENNHLWIQKKSQMYKKFKAQSQQLQKKCNNFVKKLKPNRYAHQLIEQNFTERVKKVESQQSLQLNDVRRRRSLVDWQSVKEHEQRYLETLEERKEQWLQQFNTIREQHRSRLRHYRGKFADRAREEEQQMREEAAREGQRGLKIVEKMKNYQEYVHQNFKPKHFKQTLNPQMGQAHKKRVQMDRTQIRLKGLQYLTKVKETVKSFRSQPGPEGQKINKSASLPKIKSQTVYKDYLKERPERKKEADIDQFHNALTERRGKWAESALSLISKMEVSDYKKGDKPLISSVFNKIELLNAMTRDE